MSPCTCPESSLASVAFASGVVLLRCPSHEAQAWLVDGRAAETSDALSSLRRLFDERRVTRTPARPRRPATAPVLAEAYPTGPSSADVSALLRERGFTGSWAVA